MVRSAAELPAAFAQCRTEAAGAFGTADLYVERLLTGARHLEVQLVGDRTGADGWRNSARSTGIDTW
ncbi:ATP-binding protein [Nocardia sp. NBC_00416]|uniref:ATP-binding protein n=1 Tax=Nocardia sp. NBC_00416 TaxID=2975991 RepID=UPI003FA5845E